MGPPERSRAACGQHEREAVNAQFPPRQHQPQLTQPSWSVKVP